MNKTETALLYFPDSTPKVAVRHLMRWIAPGAHHCSTPWKPLDTIPVRNPSPAASCNSSTSTWENRDSPWDLPQTVRELFLSL